MINIIHPRNFLTLYNASRRESIQIIWKNFKKLIFAESMNYGSNIAYNIEYACIIENRYLLLRGWSFAKNSKTYTLINNCGFFLDKAPSMLPRIEMFKSNPLLSHPNIGFMLISKVEHVYDQYLNIELVSEFEVVEINVKLKHYNNFASLLKLCSEEDKVWLHQAISMHQD